MATPYVCELCGGAHEEQIHADYGLRDNGHCGNCTCMTCRMEYGAMPVQEFPTGDDE